MKIYLKTKKNQYVSAEGGGGGAVNAKSPKAGDLEMFDLIVQDGGNPRNGSSVSFQTFDEEHYLSAAGGGGGLILAKSPKIDKWEKFTIWRVKGTGEIASGDQVHLRVYKKQYVTEVEGGEGLVALRTDPPLAPPPANPFTLEVV